MGFNGLFPHNRDNLEDFWGRRQNRPRFERTVQVFDRQIRVGSNDETVLSAVDNSLPLYSVVAPSDGAPFSVQFVVQAGPLDPGPPPENLSDYVQYTGEAAWLTIRLSAWGHCYIDLNDGHAVAVLSPRLAQRPDLVSLCLLNTILTNFFIGSGYGMLHASCLLRNRRALLLLAPHNSGKSTTALRLALAGYQLVSDSMIFLSPASETVQLLGFPVGKVKLRGDMVAAFPLLHALLEVEPVRDETKYGVDLRRLDPGLVCDSAVTPEAIDLCLLTRSNGVATRLMPATREAVVDAVTMNSLFLDTDSVWRRNLALIERLLEKARCYQLAIGSDADGILGAVNSLPLRNGFRWTAQPT